MSAPQHRAAAVVPQWTLGDRLRKIRRTVGTGQREFAEVLGTNAKTYAAWELDNASPRDSVALAKRIEMAYGIPAAWTLGIAAPPPDPNVSYSCNFGDNPADSQVRTVAPLRVVPDHAATDMDLPVAA